MLVGSVIYGLGFDFMRPFQNENPFSKESGFSFCIIHYSLSTIHHSFNGFS